MFIAFSAKETGAYKGQASKTEVIDGSLEPTLVRG
jgi:hypothetical protein